VTEKRKRASDGLRYRSILKKRPATAGLDQRGGTSEQGGNYFQRRAGERGTDTFSGKSVLKCRGCRNDSKKEQRKGKRCKGRDSISDGRRGGKKPISRSSSKQTQREKEESGLRGKCHAELSKLKG